MTHNAIYFTWAIWLARKHAIMLVWLRPSFTSECVQTLFFDKATDSYRLTIYYSYIITTMYLHNHTLLSVPALNITCIICLICNSIIISPMPRIWTMARAPTKQNPLNEHSFFIFFLILYVSSYTPPVWRIVHTNTNPSREILLPHQHMHTTLSEQFFPFNPCGCIPQSDLMYIYQFHYITVTLSAQTYSLPLLVITPWWAGHQCPREP